MKLRITTDARMNRLLAALPAAEWQRWLQHLEPVELALGQVLYEPGWVSPYAYFPTTAVVSLVYKTEDGECDEVAVVGREGIVGIASYMGGGRSTPATATVQRAGSGIRLPAHWIKEEFERSAAVMRVLLSYSLALTVQVAQTALCNRHHTLDHRLARRLLQGLDRQQDREFATTQEQLAGLLGVRRESITVEAHKLQQAGVVRYSRGHIFVLDRLALERRACECYGVLKREFDQLVPREAAAVPAHAHATHLGLTESLQILARDFGRSSGIKTTTHLEEADIDDATQLTVYRMVQESLNNASKYAQASDARIVLLNCGPGIVMSVRDNGKGFDTAALGTFSHGLAGMRQRVESCGGELKVNSEPGRGTLIAAVFPKQPGASATCHRQFKQIIHAEASPHTQGMRPASR